MELPGSITLYQVNLEDMNDGDKLQQQYPPRLLAFSSALRIPIAPGDTISFAGDSTDESTFKYYHARILQIVVDPSSMIDGDEIPFHPEAHHSSGMPIMLAHIALTKSQSFHIFPHAIWKAHSAEVIAATSGLEECAFSNLLLWITPEQIVSLVPILHQKDCVDQKFGPVHEQLNCLFTTGRVYFPMDAHLFSHTFVSTPASEYEAFGPSSHGHNPRHVTETEALLSLKHRVSKIGDKCLTNMRAIGGVESVSEHMSRGEWATLVKCLGSIQSTLLPIENSAGNDMRETKHVLVHANLSLETKKLPNIRQTITARTKEELHAVRCFCSGNLGIGVRKRPPSLSEHRAGRGIKTLQIADTVHMVDTDLHNMMEEAEEEGWISTTASNPHTFFDEARNFIRFKYDFRLQKFTMSVKAISLNVGKCRAEPVLRFLKNNNIRGIQSAWPTGNNNHLVQFPELRIHRRVWYDDDVYVIDGVDEEDRLIHLHNEQDTDIGVSVGIDDTSEYRVM